MKTEKLENAKIELIAWLNDECPKWFPPLKTYITADLSHDFAEILRKKLDNIIILKGRQAEKTDEKNEKPYSKGKYIQGEGDIDYYQDENGSVSYA